MRVSKQELVANGIEVNGRDVIVEKDIELPSYTDRSRKALIPKGQYTLTVAPRDCGSPSLGTIECIPFLKGKDGRY